MSTLAVCLPAAAASAAVEYAWALGSDDGAQVREHGACAAALLPGAGRASRIVAVVPPEMLSWHQVKLPQGIQPHSARTRTRMRAVLHGLLEERVLDDCANLHFALQPDARAGGPCLVAACHQHWLRGHLHALQAAGRAANALVPLCAPSESARIWLIGTESSPWLLATVARQADDGPQPTLTCLPWDGSDLAQASALLQALPPSTPVRAWPALARMAQRLGRPLTLLTQAGHALHASTRGAQGWELAQFDLDLGRGNRMRQGLLAIWGQFWRAPQYRPARWAAALLPIVQVLGLNAWVWQENRAIAALRQQTQQVLRESFPEVAPIIDAPVQMQRQVDLLRQASGAPGPGDLEPLLAAAALATAAPPRALQYQPGQLRLQGLALDEAALLQAQQRLADSGVRVQQDGEDVLLQASDAREGGP